MPAILIVEDEPVSREALAVVVAIMGYEIVTAESGEEAMRLLDQRADVSLVLCDICLPGMDGIAFGDAVRERHPALKIAFVTGDADAVDAAIRAGEIAMLKPYNYSLLVRVIEEVLGKSSSA
jgi:DNA-binding NtrC family response regulator